MSDLKEQILSKYETYVTLKQPHNTTPIFLKENVLAAMEEYAKEVVKNNAVLPHVRFQLPSDQQIVELAILFNNGNLDKEILIKMVSLANFIIDRLYENGDVSKPSSKEGN